MNHYAKSNFLSVGVAASVQPHVEQAVQRDAADGGLDRPALDHEQTVPPAVPLGRIQGLRRADAAEAARAARGHSSRERMRE